ncbi:MAG TPA: molybdopterin-dependent oxidoreductase [Coleofasciculaceae cyanobacterium]|jgi:DMSO/TMAO reductase YedYZ molybdopterin-dependent catalytic subunit
MFHSLYNRSTGTFTAPKAEPQDKAADKAFLAWPVSYFDGFRNIDPDHWEMEVTGLVSRSMTFNLKDLMGFIRIQQNRRLVFADGWTYRAPWEGFVLSELLHRVAPLPEAQYIIQTSLSGQVECMALRDLLSQRALFCMRVAGKPLPPLYGGPLRLLVFDRYAHKGLGQIAKLEFSEHPVPGFFAGRGYDPEGHIEPGNYYCADLKIMQTIRTPGEVTQW